MGQLQRQCDNSWREVKRGWRNYTRLGCGGNSGLMFASFILLAIVGGIVYVTYKVAQRQAARKAAEAKKTT